MTTRQQAAWLKKRIETARRCRCWHCREFIKAVNILRKEGK